MVIKKRYMMILGVDSMHTSEKKPLCKFNLSLTSRDAEI